MESSNSLTIQPNVYYTIEETTEVREVEALEWIEATLGDAVVSGGVS